MGNNYLFSLQPTFTQGLILGQLSILVLLILVLKYLFLDSSSRHTHAGPAYQPLTSRDLSSRLHEQEKLDVEGVSESTEWFNVVLNQVVEAYRSKLRNDCPGPEGDEVARRKVEEFANRLRPVGLFDIIHVHAIDLGCAAPRLANARVRLPTEENPAPADTEFDMSYRDTVSISLSTAYLFNYPKAGFARLPVSLTISLSLFASRVVLTPPSPTSSAPTVTMSIPPTFTLDLETKSLLGSRAILADVPKLHELVEHQVRRTIAQRGTWKVVLPGLSSVPAVKEEAAKEFAETLSSTTVP